MFFSLLLEPELLHLSNDGDISARNKLIEHNLCLIAHILILKQVITTALSHTDMAN